MLKAIIPGSFDPPTNGHLNLIHRAAEIYEKIYIVIAVNPNKKYTFNQDERYYMMKTMAGDFPNMEVHIWDRLVVDFAKKVGAKIIIRGVRAVADFAYEFELSMMNKGLNPDIETIFMTTDPKYFVLRSSTIKELAGFGGDISSMVPPHVLEMINKKVAPDHPR
ncbi:MAG: pantetheine-phosphate adenylyltransferase [Spirochaetia bacterium]